MKTDLAEIERHAQATRNAISSFRSAKTGHEFRDSWESFLTSFSRTIGKMITYGLSHDPLKPWANRLKQSSTRSDEGLVYLREARNVTEHGLFPSADTFPGEVRIGGSAFVLADNCNAVFSGNTVNGRPMGDFSITTKGGKVVELTGKLNLQIEENPAKITLVELRSEQKRRSYPIPNSIGGRELVFGDPLDLLLKSSELLDEKLKELRSQVKSL